MLMSFAVLIALVSAMPRSELSSTWVTLLRVCFPSWRFFGDPSIQVQLLWRLCDDEGAAASWHAAMHAAERTGGFLVWNPRATLRLAEESAVRDALAEIDGLEETRRESIEDLVSFQLLRALAEASIGAHLQTNEADPPARRTVRYELVVRSRRSNEDDFSDHLRVPPRPFTHLTREDAERR